MHRVEFRSQEGDFSLGKSAKPILAANSLLLKRKPKSDIDLVDMNIGEIEDKIADKSH